MILGKRLKEARKVKKLTQVDVAQMIGSDDTTISKYENNHSDPDKDTLNKLADIYGVSVDWLYGRTNKKESEYALSESEFDLIIKETEEKYNVNLRDDPFVLESMRNLIDSYAKSKLNR